MKKLILFNAIIFLCSAFSLSAQDRQKDTIYFDYSENYMLVYDVTPNKIYIKDSSDDGTFFFEKIDTENNKHPIEIICLKNFVRSSRYYDQHKEIKLNDYRLWEYLDNYNIYLVKDIDNNIEYIKVRANFEIE